MSDASEAMRLLLVEDNDDDAELLSMELDAAGLVFELRRVETLMHLRDAMAAFLPHMVISDSNLPGFTGLEAMSLVLEVAPATPFVFLSGDDDEHMVAYALTHGACGYISKQHLTHVPSTIVRLLSGMADTTHS